MVENLTEDGGVVWGCCLITPSALSAPIYQSSHRFNEIQQKDYLWEFVLICGRKNNYFLTLHTLLLVDLLTRRPVDFLYLCVVCVNISKKSANFENSFLN